MKKFLRVYKQRIFKWISLQLLNTPTYNGPKSRIHVGSRVSLSNTLLNVRSGSIKIGDDVIVGHNCMFLTGFHDYTKSGENSGRVTLEDACRDIIIEDGVWVASGVTIIGPCKIGKNAVIGAGSIVVKNIPPNTFSAGNPARVIKNIEFS